ncbi:MAG: hypothetical protein QNK37_11005 [Acidobacteriota bacterium]|nr:hypothetical protein [Acidobacteriota bacterium]
MGSQSPAVIPVDFNKLPEVTQDLQSVDKRSSNAYQGKVMGISQQLNKLGRGVVREIDINELQEQIGHLIYYTVKQFEHPVPYDVEHLADLYSHIKNPTVIVLRRIRRYLMAGHRKILARLEEEQARERQINFAGLDLNNKIKIGLEEMQRFQTMASIAGTVTRKLDILTKALHVPARAGDEFRLLDRFFTDPHHLRHREAMSWIESSMFQGNRHVLRKFIGKGRTMLQQKSNEIFATMERLSGIPFDRDTERLGTGFNWFSLGTPLRRGEDFVRIFENEERIENQIKRLTFFMVRSTWDADFYRKQLEEKYYPSQRDRQENCTKLARLYMEVEQRINESTNPEGEVQTAIATDIANELLNEQEAEAAREWVVTNKAKLQELKLEIFGIMRDTKALHPEVALPEQIEDLLSMEGEGAARLGRTGLPKITIMDLHQAVEALEERLVLPDGSLLADLIRLRGEVMARKDQMNHIDFQRQVRDACDSFKEYEDRLMEYSKVETRLDEMQVKLDHWILDAYRDIIYQDVDAEVLDKAFGIVVDQMLRAIRMLDYSVIDAAMFRELFDKALELGDAASLVQMDRLLHEVHTIPRQNQVLPALADWESTLGKKDFEAKQEWILENELALQQLVDDVRAELRERIGRSPIRPRRLRFEVFSLADCYAGNLRSLLEGLLRLAPVVASDSEGERLIANLQAIEAQIIEAQRVTKPEGEAYAKLKELERMNLLPDQVVQDLHVDLRENFKDLDKLLKEANDGLERVRALQNRFGGEHDTSHLSVIINIHDLESLKSIYHFVDNITMSDVKRFGVIYKQKNTVMEDLYERAYNNAEDVPVVIAKLIDKKAYKNFKAKNVVPIPLKIAILKEMPEMLEFECELLIRTLNLVSESKIREKLIYRALLKMMETAKKGTMDHKRTLRRIWVKFRNQINGYQPRNFQQNYRNNTRALMTDVNDTVGHSFDGL